MSRETWYVLEDGSCGDPREIVHGEDGLLAHKDGRKVAYAPHGPRSRGVDPAAERVKAAAAAKKPEPAAPAAPEAEAKEMAPEPPRRVYKTRDAKAD